eukprot:12469968-Prorocentrum_lima.AAC.1
MLLPRCLLLLASTKPRYVNAALPALLQQHGFQLDGTQVYQPHARHRHAARAFQDGKEAQVSLTARG